MSSKVKCTCGCNRYITYATRRAHLARRTTTGIAAAVAEQFALAHSEFQNEVRTRRQHSVSISDDHTEQPNKRRLITPESHALNSVGDQQNLKCQDAHQSCSQRNQQIINTRWGALSFDTRPAQVVEDSSDEDGEDEIVGRPVDEEDYDGGEVEAEDEESNDTTEDENDEDRREDVEIDYDGGYAARADIAQTLTWDEELSTAALSADVTLGEADLSLLRKYTLKIEEHITERTFAKFALTFPNVHHDSLKITKKQVRYLSGFSVVQYNCCINSCICFVGSHETLIECPKCHEQKLDDKGKPRKVFDYIPLVPRLRAMVANPRHADLMRYRARFEHQPGIITDVFDGSHYQSLLTTIVPASGNHPFFFFSDDRNIALGLSTNGFAPFKRRDKTCWPIILFNYNLPPDIRFQKQYCVNVGTIPGPKKPWNMDSFLWPLVQELIQLEFGVKSFDAISQSFFQLHAYLILVFGDIPAMAMVMRMKGANGISPCRVCEIVGVRGDNSNTYYVPLRRDNVQYDGPPRYNASQLPIRVHAELMEQARLVQGAPNQATSDRLSKEFGIKGVPILSTLPSISFPLSFPFDFMHLIWENLIPNLILFWTSSFKTLDHENRGYVISNNDWKEIGARTADCKLTIPSAFGAPVPNIATQQGQMTSEMYSNWTLFIAPVLLYGRFSQPKYYTHFMRLVELLKMCLEFEISEEMLDQIETGFRVWVEDYERLYYALHADRLSACTLTIHVILHIGWGIRVAGPVWTYWAFPMERHCNTLLQSIRSRRHPYASISTFVTAMAQLNQIRLKFNLNSELDLNPKKGTRLPVLVLDSYPSYKLCPPRRYECIAVHLRDKLYAALATCFEREKAIVQAAIDLDKPIVQYGRITCLGGGDTIVAHGMVRRSEDSRDASYVKYIQTVDKYAHQNNRRPEFVRRVFFGQLQRVLVLNLPPLPQLGLDTMSTVVYAIIQACKVQVTKLGPEIKGYYYQQMGAIEVVDLSTVQCLIGRVWDRNKWNIVDRSGLSTIEVD